MENPYIGYVEHTYDQNKLGLYKTITFEDKDTVKMLKFKERDYKVLIKYDGFEYFVEHVGFFKRKPIKGEFINIIPTTYLKSVIKNKINKEIYEVVSETDNFYVVEDLK